MIVTCPECDVPFDDARCTTICPHEQFLPDDLITQKDLAMSLCGKDVCFNHMPDGPRYHVQSVGREGRITLAELPGEFAPHLFVVAK